MSESIANTADLCLNLKKDLGEIASLSFEDRRNHLEFVSKPLLRSSFQVLSHVKNDLTDSQISQLSEYLISYLGFDHFTSVEALMSLFRMRSMNDDFSSILEEKVDILIETQNSKADIYKIFKVLSQLSTFDPVLSSAIFTKKTSFVNLLTNEVTLLSNSLNTLNSDLIQNLNVILLLFSNACVEETSRSMVASMYINILLKCLSFTEESVAQSKCYAATITVKLWRLIKPATLDNNATLLSLNNLSEIILKSLHLGLESSVEGLSLLCTNIQIRNKVRHKSVLDTLFTLIKSKEHTLYGIMSILALLTLPNRVLKIQQRSVLNLKDSNSIGSVDIFTSKKLNDNKLEDDLASINLVIEEIIRRKLFSSRVVSIFKSLESSKGLVGQCLKLMYNVVFPDIDVTGQEDASLKDGHYHNNYISEIKAIIKLLTAYLIGTSQNIKYNHEKFITYENGKPEFPEQDLEFRSIAIKSLCSPNISGHIEEIYGKDNEEFALSPVPFILEILVQHDIDTGYSLDTKQTPFSSIKKQIFSTFDVYYAFVALAAIASLSYERVKQSIFTLGFDSIINALNSGDEKLQFSSLQLLNEICDIPLCIAKFFNWNGKADEHYQNFTILCYLLQSNNYDSQCLALQVFYTVSRFEIVAAKLCESELFCSNLNRIFQNQDTDDALIYYALLVLSQLLPLKGKCNNDDCLQCFDESKSIIQRHTESSNEQIRESANLVINYL